MLHSSVKSCFSKAVWNIYKQFHVYNGNENVVTQQSHSQSEHVLHLIDQLDCTLGGATWLNQAMDKMFLCCLVQ